MTDTKNPTFDKVRTIVETAYKNGTSLYSEWSKTYDKDTEDAEFNSPIIAGRQLAKILGDEKGARILDVGAGTGKVAEELRRQGFTNIDAVDPCQEMLEFAKQKYIYRNIHCSVVTSSPTPGISDGEFDAAVTSGAIGPGAMSIAAISEMVRTVRSGGVIVVVMKVFEGSHSPSECKDYLKMMEDDGRIQLISIQKVDDYLYGDPGMVYELLVV